MERTGAFVRTARDMADHLDNGVIGLHWVAADGTILWANQADYEPLGYTHEEYVGHHIGEFHADSEPCSGQGDSGGLQFGGSISGWGWFCPSR
jgi:PAS domain-containing protein